jgi:arginase family enzyme
MDVFDQVWFLTDDAWEALPPGSRPAFTALDVRDEARGLRLITSAEKIDAFELRHAKEFRRFTLFGSGDFHHLSAVWMRQFSEPFVVISFDNHPDWDIRPPRWSCGAWINRALENPLVQKAAIWGCGNFECNFPTRLLGNRRAACEGRLLVHPWAREERDYPAWLRPITPETWKSQFVGWLESIRGHHVYVTIDLDCLTPDSVFTNWENGRFTAADIVWALAQVRQAAKILGGDLCGAWSEPRYETKFQRLAGWFDHPKVPSPESSAQAARLERVFAQLWPALTGGPALKAG